MSEAALQEHLRLCSQRAKAYTNEKAVEFNTAVAGALEEIAELKADKIDTNAALAFFNASGLYVDDDGDIAQADDDEEEEQDG